MHDDAGVGREKTEAHPRLLRGSLPASTPSSIPQRFNAKSGGNLLPAFYISTRFWPKSRSYRKQTIKPCLPGARTTFSDLSIQHSFLPAFASSPAFKTKLGCVTVDNRNVSGSGKPR
jgi:hypothetical protein